MKLTAGRGLLPLLLGQDLSLLLGLLLRPGQLVDDALPRAAHVSVRTEAAAI